MTRYVYGNSVNTPELVVRPDGVYRVISDLRGSPVLVVDVEDGAVLMEAQYDAWGNVLSFVGPGGSTDLASWPIAHGFAGGLFDAGTGLVRFGARDYDPSIGRWTAKDPILFAGGQANLYVYVGNAPINFLDPNGLFLDSAWNAVSDFGSGIRSYGEGLGAGATHWAAGKGWLGADLQAHSRQVDAVLGAAAYAANEYRKQDPWGAAEFIGRQVLDNAAYSAGRATTGLTVSAGLTPAIGVPLTTFSLYGTGVLAAQRLSNQALGTELGREFIGECIGQ